MLLSGIIITIAFIMTALTLQQVGSLERQAAAEPALTLAAEWRFIHDRVGSNLNVSVTDTMKDASFTSTTFPAVAATFRAAEAEKGYDVTMRLAGSGSMVNKTEWNLVAGSLSTSSYNAWDVNGHVHFTQVNDTANDGLLHQTPCPDGAAAACISGVLVAVHLSDGSSSLEEVLLYAVDQG